MKIKTITFAMKKGLPGFSSVSAGMEVEIHEGDVLDNVWDQMRREIEAQCTPDASFINKKQPNEGGEQ